MDFGVKQSETKNIDEKVVQKEKKDIDEAYK